MAQPNTFTFPAATIRNVSCNGGTYGSISIASIESLSTDFTNTNNNGEGISFDVTLNTPLRVTGFNLNLSNTGKIRFYYRTATSYGTELNSNGWILVEEKTQYLAVERLTK